MIDLHEIAFIDIFPESQVFRLSVHWTDYLALDSLVTLATPNLALLRFLTKQKSKIRRKAK